MKKVDEVSKSVSLGVRPVRGPIVKAQPPELKPLMAALMHRK